MKAIRALVTFMIVCVIFGLVFSIKGNSAPLQDFQLDTFNLIPVDNTDIFVKHEELVFDFTESDLSDHEITSGAKVTATYEMINPGMTRNVRMGFPYVVYNLDEYMNLNVSVTANKNDIDTKLYFKNGFNWGNAADLTFEEIVTDIIPEDYRFDDDLVGNLYSIQSFENTITLTVEYDNNSMVLYNQMQVIDSKKANGKTIITLNNNSANYGDNHWLYCPNGELKIEIKTKGEVTFSQKSYNNLIEDYLSKKFPSFEEGNRGVGALLTKKLEECLDNVGSYPFRTLEDIYYEINKNLLVLMVYDIRMYGYSISNNVSISYYTRPSYNRSFKPTIYTLTYITNPSKNWANFGTFNVKIIPPADNQYLVDSSLEFTKNNDGSYSTSMEGLPKENIMFVLSASETPVERNHNYLKILLYLIMYAPFFLLPLLLVIIAIVTTIIIIIRKRKQKSS